MFDRGLVASLTQVKAQTRFFHFERVIFFFVLFALSPGDPDFGADRLQLDANKPRRGSPMAELQDLGSIQTGCDRGLQRFSLESFELCCIVIFIQRPTNANSQLWCKKEMLDWAEPGDLINAYKYLQGGCQEDGAKLFPVVPSDRTRGNGHKLKQRKLQLNMRKNFFPLRVTEPWNRLPREAVESPSLEIFQTRLNKVLCSLL